MPSRDASGKRLSGAQQRKRAGQARERARAEQTQRVESGALSANLERLARLGPPPPRVTEHLTWASAIVAETLYQVVIDATIDEDKRRTQIATLGDRLAKLYPRAQLEETLARLEREYAPRRPSMALDIRPGHTIDKPHTARGGARGPRPLPPATDEPGKLE